MIVVVVVCDNPNEDIITRTDWYERRERIYIHVDYREWIVTGVLSLDLLSFYHTKHSSRFIILNK